MAEMPALQNFFVVSPFCWEGGNIFLISAVVADREVGETFCRTMLSVLLEREIGNICVHAQQFVSALTPMLRGIRMDVEVEEVGEVDGATPMWKMLQKMPSPFAFPVKGCFAARCAGGTP